MGKKKEPIIEKDTSSVVAKATIPKFLKHQIEEDSKRIGCSQSYLIGEILYLAYNGVSIEHSLREHALVSIKYQTGRE